MKILPVKLILVFAVLCSASMSFGQTKTLLVNGVATKINVADAEIVSIYDSVPGYMDGYEAAISDPFTKVKPRLQSEIAPAVVSTTTNAANVRYVDVDKEMNFDNSLFFTPSSAQLTTKGKAAVKNYADTMKSGGAKTVLLKSWHLKGNKISKQLVKARLDACKASFIAQGIGTNVILTSLTAAEEESKFVTIVLK